MNAKYTPGPWKMNAFLQPSENHRGWGIYWKGDQSRAFGRRIADVFPDCDSRGDPSEEAQANARLIAAAPEYHAAAALLLDWQKTAWEEFCRKFPLSAISFRDWLPPSLRALYDAHAKAEGTP